jgi:Tol biopolymer transport system component
MEMRRRLLVLWPFVVVGIAALSGVVVLTTWRVRVVTLSPVDGSQRVSITTPIHLGFSRLMDEPSVESRFRIEPEVAGMFIWQGKTMTFKPDSSLSPGVTYTVTLQAGARAQSGRSSGQTYSWHFATRSPQLLYLDRTQTGSDIRQLFVAAMDGSAPSKLTDQPWGVWDYAVHPRGEAVVYSAVREDGGTDLWRMDRDGGNQRLLLQCQEAACLAPAWSPDGQQLAYERRELWAGAPNLDPKASRIWILDLESGQERPLFDYDVPLNSPVWAPEGSRLAYASPLLPGVEVYDLKTQDLQQYGNEWGAAPVWSPAADQLVMPDLVMAGEELAVRLARVDLGDNRIVDISGDDDLVKDLAPAWSPGGGWIAFGRQFLDQERWTPGRQIWLCRPDGSEAYALLTEPMADHWAFAWRPDGGALVYLQSDLSQEPQATPEVSVWLYDLEQRAAVRVTDDGVFPKWLP